MRKTLYLVMFSMMILMMVSIYNYSYTSKETSNMDNYNLNDYEDIIIKNGDDKEKLLALTFDDGPDEVFTPQILDILKKYDVKATFFVMGQKVEYNKNIIKREFEEGHEIGNHTYTHINVSKQSYDTILNEITKTQESIKSITGVEPKVFRPPYRAVSKDMCKIIKDKNMNIVLWSYVDAKDWQSPGTYSIVRTIEEGVKNGCIILLHDYNKIRNEKSQTIEALEVMIPDLLQKGYRFVTASELIEHMEKNSKVQESTN